MNRRHLILLGGGVSGLLLLYCLCFGPVVYLVGKATSHGLMPRWLDDAMNVVFHPHVRCMYHSERYFDYIRWCVISGVGTGDVPTWVEFRATQDHPDQ